ncbi:hypothetical protein Q765_17055 [Flavobacterium rivuli WB 3.3-2 = DSM 21788]|uniref:Uncharacterized protein n=1 Tax=Flavobacterium rivuli WB 3.3-2 = DSM 21788 TaxID=1121895 RepID=A0A0A2LY60_9FLAO|nr:hypothetical protein [Flavobacterium rivuli]KGO85322.1 hypothetical protein Q765_17055 [Flavobacterium rivuli WB 3.3-2 = DSM 21788]
MARNWMVYLTENGKLLFDAIKIDGAELAQQYKKILGSGRYEKMIDSLLDLVMFHEAIENEK